MDVVNVPDPITTWLLALGMLSTLKPEPATHADPFQVVVVCAQAGEKPKVIIPLIRKKTSLFFNKKSLNNTIITIYV
jgi:hypothetical protein